MADGRLSLNSATESTAGPHLNGWHFYVADFFTGPTKEHVPNCPGCEIDRLKTLLRELDGLICEIESGNQGSFTPKRGTVSMAELARKKLRAGYPIEEMWRDEGLV